ncbi:hypothetical protein FA95DRAFT_1604149 [Auriscalpium vulgare]|uniref:Uncharacterized protein n=1 Tax=Auriscalpium vulgare TaxID=40419 RepID=A0ACB8RZR8_9AGAM|nr:hypothetical protein FA95DRAFT_1604149 [Auriscalpium vulgare]
MSRRVFFPLRYTHSPQVATTAEEPFIPLPTRLAATTPTRRNYDALITPSLTTSGMGPFTLESPALQSRSRQAMNACRPTLSQRWMQYLAVQRSLDKLLTHRNSFVPINRLPIGILAHIFTIYAEDTRPRWRRLATTSSLLGIYLAHASSPSPPTNLDPSPLLLSENLPAPLLESLSIGDYDGYYDQGAQLKYLSVCAPALRTLKINTSYPDLPWTAAQFTQLASLDLEYHGPTHSLSFLDDILNALEHMYSLESLSLSFAFPDPPPFRTRPLVVLSRLKYPTIVGYATPTTQSIESFRAPACIKLSLTLYLDRGSERRDSRHMTVTMMSVFVIDAFRRMEDALAERGETPEEEGDICITIEGYTPEIACMCRDAVASAELRQLVVHVDDFA